MEVKSSSAEGDSETLTIRVELSLFSESAAMRAAHRLTDRFCVTFQPAQNGLMVCFSPRGEKPGMSSLEGEFGNLLLDEELRERIARETEGERALIMAHALSRQPLIASPSTGNA